MSRTALLIGLAVMTAPVPYPVGGAAAAQVTLRRSELRRVLEGTSMVERVSPRGTDTVSVASAETVPLRRGEVLVRLGGTAAPVRPLADSASVAGAPNTDHLRLFEFMTLDLGNRPRMLAVTAQPQGGGLRHNGQQFVGVVYLGIEDSEQPAAQAQFAPVDLQIISHADRTDPDRIQMTATIIPSKPIHLNAAAPGTHVPLYVWVQGQQGRTEYLVPVLRSRIRVATSVARPQGLGLDEIHVSVSLPDDAQVDSVTVRLSAGSVSMPRPIIVRRGQSSTVTIRSKGIGVDTITAEGPSFLEAGVVALDFRFPWWFLGAALVGGLIGALIGGRLSRRRGKPEHARWAELVAGLAGGLVVAVLYTLGVNLTGLPIGGSAAEAGVFVVAVVGSLVGLPVLLKVVPGGGASGEGDGK